MCLEQRVCLLIVDDDPSIVTSLRGFASGLRFETLETIDPKDALALASRQHVDVALIDLHMPDMNGIQLMHLLRRIHSDIRVILITGDHSTGAASDAIKAGAFDFLRKPLRSRELGDSLHAVRQHVLRRTGAVEPELQSVGEGCGPGGRGSRIA